MNLRGEPAYVGRHCGSKRYQASPEVAAFYADALDDHSALYERFAPPLLHHSECYEFIGEWYLKNLFGNLHARQEWQLFEPIPLGAALQTRSTIVERYHKRGRDYVVNETDVLAGDDASGAAGRIFVRGRTHQSFLPPESDDRPKGFVVDEKTAAQKAARRAASTSDDLETGELLPTACHTIDQRRCWMFSGPGATYHTDAEQAKKLGFPAIVVQGMMTTCFVSQVMLARFGEGWLRGGRMDVKLTNVVWCDDVVSAGGRVLRTEAEGSAERVHCRVWVDKEDGTRVLAGEASALAS